MSQIFEFSGIEKSEETLLKTWAEFRECLFKGEFDYDNLACAKEVTFLKVFNDMFSDPDVKVIFEKNLYGVKESYSMCRGAKITSEQSLTYERFIPNKDFIKEDNRFSPKGVEWLYLALGKQADDVLDSLNPSEKCCVKECRAVEGDSFALCSFEIDESQLSSKVIDLTIGLEFSYSKLNEKFNYEANKLKDKLVKQALRTKKIPGTKSEFTPHAIKWIVYTYTNLMAEQLFTSVDGFDRTYMYAPFHCLAHYFMDLGYVGLIFSSTVFPEGKNLVLFGKDYAKPVGDIRKIEL